MTVQHSQTLRENSTEQTTEATETQSCPECGGSVITDETHAETTCRDCGLVVTEDEIDSGPEWRAFTKQDKDEKSRVGAPLTQLRHDKGLTTNISWKDKDANGRTLPSKKRDQMRRLRKWQKRICTKDWKERNFRFAFTEMSRMASALGVPNSVSEVGAVIYRRAHEEDLLRSRSIEGISTAALYAACRQEGIPRNLDEMTAVSRVGRVEIGRAYRHISQNLGLGIGPVDPKKYVPRICSELDCSDAVEAKANEIIDTAAENQLLSGKSPNGLAGAAIYTAALLCNEECVQREVADAADVTEVTIRNRYQEQLKAMKETGSA